ncbi:hypothetical protein CTM50_03635 [Prevotella intermedia]|uniref:Uncharacterized protein n=1 Tax=Prevotella intermedia TaxID=28131 RepID=A0A2D3N9W8_PREIN|nr:hypothetical protein CTM50_03635 [Prevotella intermedia]
MHGKSGSFGRQNSRFRSAKSKLAFFLRIIFTKLRLFYSFTIRVSRDSSFSRFFRCPRFFFSIRGVINHAPTCITDYKNIRKHDAPTLWYIVWEDIVLSLFRIKR